MPWFRALAALCFASTALAQGSVGGDESVCSASQAFVYKGCYSDSANGRHVGFSWQLSSSTSDAKYFPGFTGTMNVEICLAACRGHGFKWAALYYGTECYCAPEFPLATNPSSTTSGPGTPAGTAPGTPTTQSQCGSVCNGNANETCGGGGAASVYFDPSFTNNTAAASDPGQYKYLGCFNNVNPGPMYMSIATTSTVSCVTYCGLLGYPFSARSGIDSNTGSTTCGCGSEIQSGLQIAESNCFNYCNGSATAV